MDIPAGLLPGSYLWSAAVLYALFLCLALVTAPWTKVVDNEAFGVNALAMGIVPILFIRAFLYVCQRRLPHNFFIYIFVNAFLAGALSMLLAGLASAFIQQQAGVHPTDTIGSNFLLILPMLMFGEAFLNGAVITLAVAYKPQWVATFHDRWYLQGK